MTVATAAVAAELWQGELERLLADRSGEPELVRTQRRRAMERFAGLGFPSSRQEEWRFTNVAPIARTAYGPAPQVQLAPEQVEPFTYPGMRRLVFVDGRFVPERSSLGLLGQGLVLGSLRAALGSTDELGAIEQHLGRHAGFDAQPFVALNTALWSDGAYLRIPRGLLVEEPIHVLHLATAAGAPYALFPRTLVVAEEASQATLLETFVGLADGVYFQAPVTEIVTGPASVVHHAKLQQESTSAFHVATFQSHHERASTFHSVSISLGGALVRNDVNAYLAGEGVDCTLDGLYLVTGTQLVDYHMRVDHAAAHCQSHELFKGILEGHGRSVFNGLIYVHPGAQKTDAKQSSKNLILSPDAVANANPQLLIFADDVKCTHGSTTGHLDDEAVFYLRSRGIGFEAARSLLTYAFAHEILDGLKIDSLRRELEEFLFTRLPNGEVVRQAV